MKNVDWPASNKEVFLEACVCDGAVELTLRAEEANDQKTFSDVTSITNDRWDQQRLLRFVPGFV